MPETLWHPPNEAVEQGVGILVYYHESCSVFVFRRVVLASGSKGDSGYGANHPVVEWLLDRAKTPGWTRASTVITDAGSRSHAKKIASSIEEAGADLLHITNQLDAGMVPAKSVGVPVVVSVHDLYDFRPRAIDAGDVPVPLGDRFPSSAKSRLLSSCKEGMSRADMLLCSSNRTLVEAREMFPDTRCELVRDSVDESFWDPRKLRDREDLGDAGGDEDKCLIVSVGEKDPRWRSQFVDEVISMLPEDVREDILLVRIGSGKVDLERVATYLQHAECLLYPGVSVGFQSPPLEAMASGCPVLASDLPLQDEYLPPRSLLPATDPDHWVSAIVDVHSEWVRAGGVPRLPDEELVSMARSFGREAHGVALSRAYDLALGSVER